MKRAVLALCLIASPVGAQIKDDDVIPNFVGAWDFDASLTCYGVMPVGKTWPGLAKMMLSSLSHSKSAGERFDSVDKTADMLTLVTDLLRATKEAANDFTCAEQPLAQFNQRNVPADLRSVAQSALVIFHQHIELNKRMIAFAGKLSTINANDFASQASDMQVARGKIWRSMTPIIQLMLLRLVDPSHPNAEGKLDRLILSKSQKDELTSQIHRDFPSAEASNIANVDEPSYLATLYLTLLNRKATDE